MHRGLSILALFFAFALPARADDPACPGHYAALSKDKLEELVLEDPDRNLFEAQQATTTPEEARTWNAALLQAMDDLPMVARNEKRLNGLDSDQRTALFRLVRSHPVADSKFYAKYAPKGGIGFCFGRAITAHIEALRFGLAKEDIKKIWIVGGMDGGSTKWGHHVATIVRGSDKKWYTIDPNYSTPLLLEDWYKKVSSGYKNDGRLQLFVTNPQRFGPKGGVDAGPILPTTVKDPFYNRFFEDLMAQSRRDAHAVLEEKQKGRAACPVAAAPPALPDSPVVAAVNLAAECISAFIGPFLAQ